jgi:ElaB/YqjD/DUF883 family membrane-anchored ribosome-binding protein
MKSEMMNSLAAANEKIGDMVHSTGKRVGEAVSNIACQASEQVENGKNYVKANPVKGAFMAAAVGALAGCAVTTMLRKNARN